MHRFRRLFIFLAVVAVAAGGFFGYRWWTSQPLWPWGNEPVAIWLTSHPGVTPHIGTVTGTGSRWTMVRSREDAVRDVLHNRAFTDTRCGDAQRRVRSLEGVEGTAELHMLTNWKRSRCIIRFHR